VSRQEILDAGGVPSRPRTWWSRLPPRRRRVIASTVGVVVGVVMVAASVVLGDAARAALAERARRDLVELGATLDVNAVSSAPGGGAVWFAVDLRNDGPLPVRIEGLRGTAPGLEVSLPATSVRRLERLMPLAAGEQMRLTVSARLDCAARLRAAGTSPVGPGLIGRVDAVPADGRHRVVELAMEQARLLTDVADTTCRHRSGGSLVELSGPVARR